MDLIDTSRIPINFKRSRRRDIKNKNGFYSVKSEMEIAWYSAEEEKYIASNLSGLFYDFLQHLTEN